MSPEILFLSFFALALALLVTFEIALAAAEMAEVTERDESLAALPDLLRLIGADMLSGWRDVVSPF